MYRLVLYYLTVVWVAALGASFFDLLPFSTPELLFSTVVILGACWITNEVFASVFRVPANVESVYITGFILALLIAPVSATDGAGIGFLLFASVTAIASKYILALGKKHLFNPAAFGIAFSALALHQSATWWAGGSVLLMPFVLTGGLLVVRKIRRFDLVVAFLLSASITIALAATDSVTALTQTVTHFPLFFLALVMLTEPLTMPPTRAGRIAYGVLVGVLFAPNVSFWPWAITPEQALLIGNLFVYAISPKGRFVLTLKARNQLASATEEFIFTPDRPFAFSAGQYLEWTLEPKGADARGNRRYFTIASSPTESDGTIRLGVKFNDPSSTFKHALQTLKAGDTVSVASLAGDFTLPKDPKKKLVFIAGGIGVTPFRSHVQYLMDTHDSRAVTLFYSNKTAAEIAYKDVFDRAASMIGMKTVYALTNEPSPVPGAHNGFIDGELIAREVPDYKECVFYISGPHGMVEAFKKTLRDMGVSRFAIKTDYFPGFV